MASYLDHLSPEEFFQHELEQLHAEFIKENPGSEFIIIDTFIEFLCFKKNISQRSEINNSHFEEFLSEHARFFAIREINALRKFYDRIG